MLGVDVGVVVGWCVVAFVEGGVGGVLQLHTPIHIQRPHARSTSTHAAFAQPYARLRMSAALAPPLEGFAVSALPGGRTAVASPYGGASSRARQCSHHSHP